MADLAVTVHLVLSQDRKARESLSLRYHCTMHSFCV